MVKKILIGLGGLIAILLIAAVVLPIIFKDDIIALAKTEANKQLNAEVDFGDIGLSMFSNFPDFTLRIENIKVTGKAPFEGVELANIQAVVLSLDIMSVINGDKIEIKTVGLEKPNLHVIVLADGTANYDIAKASDEEPEVVEETPEADTASGGFAIGLQSYFIRNANIIYDDRAGGMYANLKNFTHEGSGDFTQDDFLLKTLTNADAITFRMGATPYLNRTALDMKFDMNMNLPGMRFEFVENYVKLNALHLGFDGTVAMPPQDDPDAEGPIDLDITFETKETTFKSLLSMVPAIFLTDFEDIETAGSLALSGFAKGRMIGDQLPAFGLDLTVNDAMFHYPDLPKSAENIAIDLHVNNPGGSDDNTVVDLKKLHVELAQNPIDVVLYMTTPISDPFIRAAVNANVDLASLKDVIPLEEGQSVTGKVISDIQMEGNQSAIDKEQYDQFKAQGSLVLLNLDYQDPAIAYETLIKACSLNFSPQYAELTQLDVNVGKSDLSMTGRVDNIVSWYVADAPLSGAFNLSSNLLDLNEFMTEEEGEGGESESAEEATSEESEEGGVAEIPAGFDFTLNTNIKKLVYDNIDITNVNGKVTLADQRASMDHLIMNLMDGALDMSGYYDTKNPVEPAIDFQMNITNWDVVKTFQTFESVQKMAPIMENATGRFSTGMDLTGLLDQNMDPQYNTLDGGGMLTTKNVLIKSPQTLTKIADAIKYNDIKDLTLNDVDVSYRFEDGRIEVDPVDFKIGGSTDANFSGSHGFDQTLDYVLKLNAPTSAMGGAANQAIAGLFSQANQALGTNAAVPDRIKMDVLIGGTSDDPKITPKLAGTEGGSNPVDDLKDRAKDEIDKKKKELEDKAKAEADKAKQRAEAERKKAEDRARKEADDAKKRAEAERKKKEEEARKRAAAEKKKAEEAAKKKAEEEAKKKLKGIFK